MATKDKLHLMAVLHLTDLVSSGFSDLCANLSSR